MPWWDDGQEHRKRCVVAMMIVITAWMVAGTLAAIGTLHIYWALRGTAGIVGAGLALVPEVGGRPAFTPGPVWTLAIAVLLGIAAALVALQGKLFVIGGLPSALTRVGALGAAAVLAARGVGEFRLVGLFKRVRGTRFARLDSLVYTPLCLALAAGIVIVAVA
jgi:hypothetical protein